MSHAAERVPYGYEPPIERNRGTLIYYDSFERVSDEELDAAVETAEARSFARIVLYLIHEETVRRMSKLPAVAYHKREKRLLEWKRERGMEQAEIDGWEGKRKKYTPIDAALRHLTETLPAPHFLYLSPEMANTFASFASFEDWIVKIRLILATEPEEVHPRLERYRDRWDVAAGLAECHTSDTVF
ncbi:hypothetical protein COLU111180_14785 [Cohnella lubricantis]|uniref:Uncharacterized protein n=1 Tax=Cohnella lubricantis TaxID=2163172 RepID=A0A841TCV5_9BACL|nr:hypothetical protein [Cohnella lubricantis]MBB6677845.1 hypothetical protein [Cohnella lubricantis]MBP2119024.1 hypothetical protein [Cohnella lubricantis]